MKNIKLFVKKLWQNLRVAVVSNCFLFGHRWSKNQYKQICLNKNCNATRIAMYRKYTRIGEPSITWHYFNMDDVKLK